MCAGKTSEENEVFILGQVNSAEQRALADFEKNIFLSDVLYEDFWGKIKLVGYTMQLRPEHMEMIAPSINLDYENDLHNRSKSFARFLMCDPRFGFKDGLHEPQKLLLIGFLYCHYENEEEHLDNLWHLINPNFK